MKGSEPVAPDGSENCEGIHCAVSEESDAGKMTGKYISRRGRTWYLRVKTTAAGNPNYYFSMADAGPLVESVPDGYEVFEKVTDQVFLRKKTAQIILPQELALVDAALQKHGERWRYRTEVKKNSVTVHEAGDLSGLDRLAAEFGRGKLSASEKERSASYMAVLRFTLVDKKTRTFVTERFCFRGIIDEWIFIGDPGTLSSQVGKFVKHLGGESFYEL